MKLRPWLIAVALAAATWLGCVTPSVPIPPPDPENMSFQVDGDAGVAQFQYDPDPSYALAVVYVFNRDVGEGVITTATGDGSVGPTAPFAAAEGDHIVISFEKGDQLSSRCVILRPGRSGPDLECDL